MTTKAPIKKRGPGRPPKNTSLSAVEKRKATRAAKKRQLARAAKAERDREIGFRNRIIGERGELAVRQYFLGLGIVCQPSGLGEPHDLLFSDPRKHLAPIYIQVKCTDRKKNIITMGNSRPDKNGRVSYHYLFCVDCYGRIYCIPANRLANVGAKLHLSSFSDCIVGNSNVEVYRPFR